MGLDDVLRSGVALANRLTGDLQVTVSHERWNGVDDYGQPTYASAVNRKAIVNRTARRLRNDAGEEVVSTASILFLTPIPPLVVTGRQNPIDKRDRISISLPGGGTLTGPILSTEGIIDAGSTPAGQPYVTSVHLG